MTPRGATTTRAAVWRGGDRLDVEAVPVPEPGPGEVVVRVLLATVCGSDRHTVTGRRAGACPSVLGHEAVGEVVAVGVTGARTVVGEPVRPGDRVVWGVTVGCGSCDRCRTGRTAKCRELRKVGHEPFDGAWPLSGTYAGHVLLPAGAVVVGVPAGMPDVVAAPAGCATATVLAAAEAAGDLAGRRVLVVGAGMLGLCATALAAEAGAEVLVTDVDPERLRTARRFGATDVLLAHEALPLVDVAFELSGATRAAARALEHLDVGGALVLVGAVAPGPPLAVAPERVVRGWWRIAGVHNYEPRHLGAAVDLLERTRGHRPWHELVDPPVGLADLGRLLSGPPGPRPRPAVDPGR